MRGFTITAYDVPIEIQYTALEKISVYIDNKLMAETSTIFKAIMGKTPVISFMHSFSGDKKRVEIFVKKDIKDKIKLCINGGYIAGDDF